MCTRKVIAFEELHVKRLTFDMRSQCSKINFEQQTMKLLLHRLIRFALFARLLI